jgi:hypothetical protein
MNSKPYTPAPPTLSLYCCSTSYSAGTSSRHTSHLQPHNAGAKKVRPQQIAVRRGEAAITFVAHVHNSGRCTTAHRKRAATECTNPPQAGSSTGCK